MTKPPPTPTSGAVVIPFPRFASSKPRKALSRGLAPSPDFDAGFEFAMHMVRHLKASGHLHYIKGA